MPEKPIDLIILKRIDDEQKSLLLRVDKIDNQLLEYAKDIGQIQGSLKPADKPWWLGSVVGPILAATLIAIAGASINSTVKISKIEAFLNENGGFIAGLRLQQNAADPTSPQ